MPSPIRLAYCTNVAPAETLEDLLGGLEGLWSRVRDLLPGERALGLGLWFPAPVAARLAHEPDARNALGVALDEGGFRLLTVNAFPATAFHAPVVKEAVYSPSWLEPERKQFTLDVARAVCALVPEGSDVPVSTLPLGFPKWQRPDREQAAGHLLDVADELARLREETGTTVRIAVEPEPCCAIETTEEAVAFFTECVWSRARDVEAARRHLGVCLDLCHTSVQHESLLGALARYREAGVPVHKVQVSAALEVPRPESARQRAHLERFVEPRWLHQVGVGAGEVEVDLPRALANPELVGRRPWRVHFHVPVHLSRVADLPTTSHDVEGFLTHLRNFEQAPPLLELETYTWSVVPRAAGDLARGIADEIGWARGILGRRLAP